METEIFTCKYFKFGRNTTGLSKSHLRNFLACSINIVIFLFLFVRLSEIAHKILISNFLLLLGGGITR